MIMSLIFRIPVIRKKKKKKDGQILVCSHPCYYLSQKIDKGGTSSTII